jgi:hypothetical protein
MANMGAEMKADMKTLMTEMKTIMKTNQQRLVANIETNNYKYEVLRGNMWTSQAEMKTRITVSSSRWISTKTGHRPFKNK